MKINKIILVSLLTVSVANASPGTHFDACNIKYDYEPITNPCLSVDDDARLQLDIIAFRFNKWSRKSKRSQSEEIYHNVWEYAYRACYISLNDERIFYAIENLIRNVERRKRKKAKRLFAKFLRKPFLN